MAWSGGERTAAAGNIGIGGIGATKSPSSLDSPLIHNRSRRGGPFRRVRGGMRLEWRGGGGRGLLLLAILASSDFFIARLREKRSVSIFTQKNQWSLANIDDSSDNTAFTMILVTPPRRHNGQYLIK